ncbi:exopolysaccharide biosynthesis protein [Chelativorans salis]|uniref:Exopolysaccharide biosynthesis protein n=1 Tax=Chelativorans salis TaxID=2978478 RepID=A0ABT2LKY0_9HYPH|nr:exopolysaccharide biosynthesis protein [Chelativorans sp. EGI FJ00035]MCT7375251.1 exopolysaccharide biosynthesis protein [Chelativorans sp. EGI FJ00035]
MTGKTDVKAEGTGLGMVSRRVAADLPPRRLSMIFEELASNAEGTVTVEQLRQALGDRSFATLLVFFSSINLLPLPPGSTLVLGIPLLLLSIQMVFGQRTVWLPRFILQKSLSAAQFRGMSERLIPKIKWVERLIRPRYWPFARDHADRFIGIIALILAIAVTLPIPLGNWFPAFSCALVGLALSERDGILLTVAVASGALSLIVIAVVIGAAGMLASALMG